MVGERDLSKTIRITPQKQQLARPNNLTNNTSGVGSDIGFDELKKCVSEDNDEEIQRKGESHGITNQISVLLMCH